MLSILKRPTFLLFFIGNTISLVGFGFNLIGFSWLVLDKTGSEILLGQIMAAATFPGLIVSLFAGVLIDKVNRKWLLVILDVFRMVVVACFIFITFGKEFSLSSLFLTVFLLGIGNSLFWPTATAFVQELVSDRDYFKANSLLSASYQVGSILGAGLGGIIVHFYGVEFAFIMNIGTYFLSAIFIMCAPFSYKKDTKSPEKFLSAVTKGFYFLKKESGLLFFGLTSILGDVAIWGSLTVLTISISKIIFNAGSWGYGVMDGFYGFGALFSAIISGYIVSKVKRHNFLLVCFMCAGVSCLFVPIFPALWMASLAYLVMGLANNSARIIVRTIMMEMISNKIMGRVQTIFGIYTRILVILSSLFAGYLVENHSIFSGMLFSAGHFFCAAIGILIIINLYNFRKILFN